MPASADTLPKCETAGERRTASPEEDGSECVCEVAEALGASFWRCYGPDPESPDTRGGKDSKVICGDLFVQPGDSSCLIQWACSDQRSYGISCVSDVCFCLISTEPAVELEPGTGCTEDLSTLNEHCGWSLSAN
jgi:hypothetical protein